MQVGAPRGAELWYVKDGVMRDGRIVARKFTGYFDSGAYTRLSSYAIIKAVGHLPGPYTIPNVSADVFCVYTNRTPATAMRGFGITGVDFAIEAHMDKVAETVGMNPVELRILNAYRDGDMKAHRRLAKNCALIECCQVVAEKAGVKLSPDAGGGLAKGGGGRGGAARPSPRPTRRPGRGLRRAGSYARKGGPRQAPARARMGCRPPGPARAPGAARPPPRPPAAAPPPQPRRRAHAARRDAVLLPLRLPEALSMALHRGRGFAAINYPIGMNLGGDPSQALVHSNPDGKFTVALSAIDLGPGDEERHPPDRRRDAGRAGRGCLCRHRRQRHRPARHGELRLRGTHRMGNAVIRAAEPRRAQVMLEAAAEELEVDAADLVTDGRGNIHVRGAPSRSITTMAAAQAAQFRQGRTIAGRGIFLIPLSEVDPDTGEMSARHHLRPCRDAGRGRGRRRDRRGHRHRHAVGL
jgi:CO/xanthine dehydrogenase Mo-binding subunit